MYIPLFISTDEDYKNSKKTLSKFTLSKLNNK